MNKLKNSRGFIAVIVVIMLALALVTAGAFILGKSVPPKKIKATRTVVLEAKEAVTGFAATNKRLPSQTEFETLFRSTDEWGIPLLYSASDDLDNPGLNLCMPAASPSLLTINGSAAGVFVVYSKGSNRTDETNTGPSTFVIQSPSDAYDDIVEYISLADLRKKVCHEMRITTDSLPIATEEVAYSSTTLEATDGTKPYTWTRISAAGLPPGMTLNASTGVISGLPEGIDPVTTRNYPFTVRVTDSEGRIADKNLVVTVKPNGPRVTTGFFHDGKAGQPYSAQLVGDGGKPGYKYTVVGGSIPPGLTHMVDMISGTVSPTASGVYTFTVRITDHRARTSDRRLTIKIDATSLCDPLINTTSNPLASGNVNMIYHDFITYTGGQSPVSCNIVSGSLPPGLFSFWCLIFGIPTDMGTYTFTTRVTDSCSSGAQTSDKQTQITIGCPLFTGWSSSLPTAHTCQAYPSGTISVFGGYSPYSWSLIGGVLPKGINFCSGNTSSTCSLVTPVSGYVDAPSGSYSFNVRVNDSCPLGSQNTTNSFAISVQNNTGCSGLSLYSNQNNRSYTIDGSAPIAWTNGNNPVAISAGHSYVIYQSPNGTGNASPLNFCEGLSYDSDNDCRISISGGGAFSDR
ncbi:MAG: putative Ig domain-containing protein [Nitrospirae bacterium]|nr:putative Ig domain-containing protein [Nitrospirota bacterium]